MILKGEVESSEEDGPSGLPGVQSLSRVDIFQVLVICPYLQGCLFSKVYSNLSGGYAVATRDTPG